MSSLILASSFFQAYRYSDFFGKSIFFALFILSITSWVLMIYKIKLIKKVKRESILFDSLLESKNNLFFFKKEDFENYNPYLEIYSSLKDKTLKILNKNKYFGEIKDDEKIWLSRTDIDLVESQTDASLSKNIKFLLKNLFVLSTVVTLAPFLGLLGTVWGILITFSNLDSSNINSAVLSGISMALATTVLGLIVAIPALVAYNYLKSEIKDFEEDMNLFSNKLIATLEMQYRKVEGCEKKREF